MHVACSTRYLKFLPFSAGEEIKFNKYSGECTLGGPDWFLWVSLKDLGGKLCPITILLIQTWGLRYSSEKRVSICLSPPLFRSLSPTLPLCLSISLPLSLQENAAVVMLTTKQYIGSDVSSVFWADRHIYQTQLT